MLRRVVTCSSRSVVTDAVFLERKYTGSTMSGSAHCGTELMPGEFKSDDQFAQVCQMSFKVSAQPFGVYFPVNESKLSENDPWGKLQTAHFTQVHGSREGDVHSEMTVFYALWTNTFAWLSFSFLFLKYYKSYSHLAKVLGGCSGLFVWCEFVVYSFEEEEKQQKTIEMAKLIVC